VSAFLAHLRTLPNRLGGMLSPRTVRHDWIALRYFDRWYAAETLSANPMLAIPCRKALPAAVQPLSREDVANLVKACDATRAAATLTRTSFSIRRDTATRDRAIILSCWILASAPRSCAVSPLKIRSRSAGPYVENSPHRP
jgi:hypothetical protein